MPYISIIIIVISPSFSILFKIDRFSPLNSETYRVNSPYLRLITVSYYAEPKVKTKMEKREGGERRVPIEKMVCNFPYSEKPQLLQCVQCIMRVWYGNEMDCLHYRPLHTLITVHMCTRLLSVRLFMFYWN